MYYTITYTKPTVIKDTSDYKDRVEEIFVWQIRETIILKLFFLKEMFCAKCIRDFVETLFISLFSLITLPFAIFYIVGCLIEFLVDTILLPLNLIPVVRILPIVIARIIFVFTSAIGIWGGVALERGYL